MSEEKLNKIYHIIIKYIETTHKLKNEEKLFIIDNIKKIDWNLIFDNKNSKNNLILIADKIKNTIIKNRKHLKQITQIEQDDVKKYQISIINNKTNDEKNELNKINISSILGISNYNKFIYTLFPETQYEKHYLILDSKNIFDNSNNSYKWNYSPNKFIEPGSVTTAGEIKNIVSIKVYQVKLPLYQFGGFPNRMYRTTLLIKELEPQASITSANNKYHFIGFRQSQGSLDFLYFDEYELKFSSVVQSINSFTLEFRDPINYMNFQPDLFDATINSYGATTIFSVPYRLSGLITSTYIYITNFTTDDPEGDEITINLVNNSEGLIITNTNISSSTLITVGVNTSSITPKAGLTVKLFVDMNRLLVPFEFTCLK